MSCAQECEKISRMKSIAYTFALVYVHRSFRFRIISLKLFDKVADLVLPTHPNKLKSLTKRCSTRDSALQYSSLLYQLYLTQMFALASSGNSNRDRF